MRFASQLVVVVATVALSGCGDSTSPLPIEHGLRVGASVKLVQTEAGDTIQVQADLIVQNAADSTQDIEWDCPVGRSLLLIAFTADGNRSPVWTSQDAISDYVCPADAFVRRLAPGDTAKVTLFVPVTTILGDTLPAGPYSFDVSAKGLVPSFSEEIPAGTLTLAPNLRLKPN